MAKHKNSSYLEEVALLAFLLAALWVFDRPIANRIIGDLELVGAVLAMVIVVILAGLLILKRYRRQRLPISNTFPSDLRRSPHAKPPPLTPPLNRELPIEHRSSLPLISSSPSQKPTQWTLELIKDLEWKRFEMLCAGFYEAKGYQPKSTGLGADGGIDLILYRKGHEEGKIFGIVQCKAWRNWNVNVKHVRELYGVKAAEEAALAVFITTTDYTPDAKAFAENKHLELITGDKFLSLLKGLPEPQSTALLKKVTSGDYKTPTCPHCDVKMVIRTTKNGRNAGSNFWGCRNFPSCRQRLWKRR